MEEDTSEPKRAGSGAAAEELAREVYWAALPMSEHYAGAIQAGGWSDLAVGWSELEATLRRDHGAGPLPDDPTLEMGSPWKRRFKRFTFKVLRPLMRRYDRITADLALLGLETSQELASARGDTAALTSEVQRLRAELREAQATWDTLRTEDCGLLWEHLVLDTLRAGGLERVCFWRDKQQREIDFAVPRGRDAVDAIECKWQPDAFETRNLAAFRALYSRGRNFVVSPLNGPAYGRTQKGLQVSFMSPADLRQAII